jgi:hypothetical protein
MAVSSTQLHTSPLGWPELRGTATRGGQLWALGFGTPAEPARAVFTGLISTRFPIKIIWRMTGNAPLRINAFSPTGMRVNPVWGPQRHGGSNWVHAGAEWGTGWFFWEPGCWQIRAVRGKTVGTVYFILQ